MANTKTASLVTITDLTDAPIGILSNESFVLAADLNGVVGSFSGASTTLSIKLGGVDDSANWSVSAGTPVGITGSLSGKTYTVTAMNADVGYVDLTASRAGFSNIVKRFSVAKAKQGAKGDTGATGATGAQGKGISSTVVEYKASSSGTSTPADPWSSTVPSVADNQYLWTRTTINYTDGTNTKAYSVGKMGAQGPQGNTGATGAAGVGISSTSVTYQAGSSGTTAPTGTWSSTVPAVGDNQYLWTKVVINYTSGSPTTSYSVGKMGAQGPKGAKGDTGAKGATGEQGPKGDTGVSVTGVLEKYLATSASSGVTTATSGWTTEIQTMTTAKKYLWNYEVISFSDGSSSPTLPVIIGVYGNTGNTGATGRALTAVTEYYLASPSASGITRPATDGTGGWTTTMQTTTPTNKYLWNYEKLTWSVAPLTTYVEPIIIGIHGDKGDTGAQGPQGTAGVSITSVDVEYGKSSSATTAPTSWNTATPTWEAGKYIWSRTKTTYSAGDPTYTNAACITGQAGQIGATGRGVSSVVSQYAVSTSKTTVPSNASFSTDRPTWEPGKYIWTRSLITYTSGSPATSTTTPIVSSEWEAVNEIRVGGRNLFKGTAFTGELNTNYWSTRASSYNLSIDNIEQYNGNNSLKVIANTIGVFGNDMIMKSLITPEPSTEYVFSFYAKALEETVLTARWGYGSTHNKVTIGVEWQKYEVIAKTGSQIHQELLPYFDKLTTVWIALPKLEKGNIATDWTPAPEDVDAAITENTYRIIDVELLTTPDAIVGTVRSHEDYYGDLSSRVLS